MSVNHFIAVTLTAALVAAPTARPCGGAIGAAPSSTVEVVAGLSKILSVWSAGDSAKCRHVFARDNTNFGGITADEALARKNKLIDRRAIHRLDAGNGVQHRDGRWVAESRWVLLPLAGIRKERELLITEERFSFVTVNGTVYIADYEITNTTKESSAAIKARFDARQKVFSDRSRPTSERLTAGLYMYASMLSVGDTEHIWPHLKSLVDMGINTDQQAKQLVRGMTRRAQDIAPPPPQYTQLVRSVANKGK